MIRRKLTILSLLGLILLIVWLSVQSTAPSLLSKVPSWIQNMLFWLCMFTLVACAVWPRRSPRLGLCVECGYDLRGSMERCPECFTPFSEEVKQP